ncbi:MAG TPA: LA2681 family HEPN domain-containing protein [Candidatus Tripitaka californicus]|uniref:LA2681 family HEPN domain-containing protein n=1 Tax=Candidatus Tripitaka californicus TaxID=3367616 RepID=UPI00402605BA
MNDLGPYPIAARDVFHTPSIVVGIKEGPYYHGYFNQMKQEFVSARYLYHEGISVRRPHFSDRDVRLFNTLDYPSYSLAVEKVKTAFRVSYSLFDKIAYFLNHYLHLSIPEKEITFRKFWYASQHKKKGLRPEFQRYENWPLRGLFWLSKDLYENEPDFKKSIEPDAQALSETRNHLEHKYLKLHENDWSGPPSNNEEVFLALRDTLAFSIYRGEFQAKTLRLLKMIRAALIYLSLAIHCEEQQRAKRREIKNNIVPGMPLDILEDGWKV